MVSSYDAPAREENLAALPSAYILTTGFDPLRDGTILHAVRLLEAGVAVELHQLAGTSHGFDQQVADAAVSRCALSDQIHHLERFLRIWHWDDYRVPGRGGTDRATAANSPRDRAPAFASRLDT